MLVDVPASLFTDGSSAWRFLPSINLSIFNVRDAVDIDYMRLSERTIRITLYKALGGGGGGTERLIALT